MYGLTIKRDIHYTMGMGYEYDRVVIMVGRNLEELNFLIN